MENKIEDKLSSLIKLEEFEMIGLFLKKPNIFESLNLTKQEIKHSNFLSWLLDPTENHGLSDIFLKKFLRDIFDDEKSDNRTIFDADLINYDNVEIRREWRNIDITIILQDDVIAIENKIDSQDHNKQLTKYINTIEQTFPDHKKHFVYLTPFGIDPLEEKAQNKYINYSYLEISNNIDNILHIYGDDLNNRSKLYIEDYNTTIRRYILMNDQLNELAIKIYKSHKDALDFIFENKPDPASELYPFFENRIKKENWIVGSKNKGYIRFTTKELDKLIPKGLGVGWPNKEIFLFEINYYWSQKDAIFNAVISPGDQDHRMKIHNSLVNSPNYRKHTGKKWMVNYKKRIKFNASKIINENNNEIEKRVDEIIRTIEPIVNEFSALIAAAYSQPSNK